MATGNEKAGELTPSFEEALEELETIVSQLESGAKPLEESLALYEKGIVALRQCHGILDQAEKRIRILVKGADGGVALREVDGLDPEVESPKSKVPSSEESDQKTAGLSIDSGGAKGQNRGPSTTKPGNKGGSKAGGGSLFGSAQ